MLRAVECCVLRVLRQVEVQGIRRIATVREQLHVAIRLAKTHW